MRWPLASSSRGPTPTRPGVAPVRSSSALVCLPGSPQCLACPASSICWGYAAGTAAELPVKTPPKARRIQPVTVLLVQNARGEYLLQQRPKKGLLAGLWQPLLAEEAQRDGIELLHSSWGNGPATAVWVASRLSGIPFAFTGRAGDIYPQDGILAEKSRDAIFIRTNNMANKPWLQSFCPAGQKDKVHVIYNGLTLGRRVDCRAPFQKPYRLLAIGRFARTKGFPELLTAMARLRDDGFPVRLTLVGDGNWKRKLVDMRKRLHLEDLVDMPGFVPNDRIRTFMEEHDMLVVPSVVHTNGDRDGIPNVIMEALSCGMPVVATDVCGVGEVIRNGETGYLIPQRDPAALADAIRRMLSDREAALRMAQTGRELVFRMFDTETNIAALQDLYCRQYTQWRTTHGPNV